MATVHASEAVISQILRISALANDAAKKATPPGSKYLVPAALVSNWALQSPAPTA
jgi:hypothetical protein